MLNTFTAKGFRGFEEITIDPLKRINLIVGKNNVGKTALLEGMLLLLGAANPSLSLALNKSRGLELIPLEAVEIWGWLFYNRNIDGNIELKTTDEKNITHTLNIALKNTDVTQINSENILDGKIGQQAMSTMVFSKDLILNYQNSDDSKLFTRITIDQNKIVLHGSNAFPFPMSSYLPSAYRTPPQDNASKFSELEKFGQHEEIISALKIIEPRLKRLVVSAGRGSINNINCDLGEYPHLPVSYMGDGINQLLSILLQIASASDGGCVLIDEIDNGFYYEAMQPIWSAVCDLAHKKNVQIFATTHSFEFVKAVYQAHKENTYDEFCLHRLERIDGKISIVSYDTEDLDTTFELGWEVR